MNVFVEFSLIIALAMGIAVVMRLLRQPLIIGHIITGLVAGPILLSVIQSTEVFELFSEIGIAILLFIVGLHLHPQNIRSFGKVSIIIGLSQVTITSLAGLLLALVFGFPMVTALYIAAALAFSSTIIILKLFADKGHLDELYAKIATGFLLVQDFIVIGLLFTVPLMSKGELTVESVAWIIGKGLVLLIAMFLITRYVIPRIGKFLEKSQELLFLFTIAWGLGIAAFFKVAGFGLEAGALIAGVSLTSLPARAEIGSRLTPLRDFFIILFFILLGAQMELGNIIDILPAALGFSALIIIGNPLIVLTIMGVMGYRKKTSFRTGIAIAQISEFSLIFATLGHKLGHISQEIVSLITLVGVITIFVSTYLILYTDWIYSKLAPLLSLFERRTPKEEPPKKPQYKVLLFGCNRVGYNLLETLQEIDPNMAVVDHDPERIKELEEEGIQAIYGDVSNVEFLESLPLNQVELVVSTVPEYHPNYLLHNVIQKTSPDTIFIPVAHRIHDALQHYRDGADYVILPHFLGSAYAADLVSGIHKNESKYGSLKEEHIRDLEERLKRGHEHP